MDPNVGRHYGSVRSALAHSGTPIGANDLWIAAHALAEGLVLVSNNLKEFSRVEGLKTEKWNMEVTQLVNEMLRQDIKLIEAVK